MTVDNPDNIGVTVGTMIRLMEMGLFETAQIKDTKMKIFRITINRAIKYGIVDL